MEGVNAIAHVLQTHVELRLYILAVQYLNIILSDSIFFHSSLDICPPNLYDIVIGFHFAVWIKACIYREAFLPLSNEEGLEEGLEKGLEKGEWKKLIKLVCRKLMKGENIAAISDALEEDSETIRMIVHVVEKRPDDMMDHIDEYVEEVLKIVNGA